MYALKTNKTSLLISYNVSINWHTECSEREKRTVWTKKKSANP